MPEVIGVFDGGSTIIKHKGHPANVGVIHLRIAKGEVPETITGYCRLNHKEGIIKYLGRIAWAKAEAKEEEEKVVHLNEPKKIVFLPDIEESRDNENMS